MTEPYRLRRGTPDDSRPSFEVFLPAIRDLTARQGSPWEPDPDELWDELSPMLDRLAQHSAEWWVAEDPTTGALLGYARSVERGGLFELTELFVHPDRQSAGLGADLIAHAFPDGRGEVRAIIATTDVRAQARYYAAGTAARFPIVAVEGPPRAGDLDPDVAVERLDAAADPAPLVEIEATVLEFDRGDEFRWLLEQREGYLYRRDGAPIGFAFLSPTASGPIAALQPADMMPILAHVEARAAELGVERLSLEVPMVNEVAMRHLMARGMRMDTFLTLFMSSRPFGQFDRFIGFSPPFFL
jgi:GNAT superfamily N-acetyltransferase